LSSAQRITDCADTRNMAAVVARGALRGLAAAPRGLAARPPGAAAALIARRGASMGLAAARPPPASRRCARSLSSAAPTTKPEDDGYAWVPYAVLAAIGGLGFWFWRASTAHGNRSALIDLIEDEQPLSGDERDALRDANATFLQPERLENVARSTLSSLRADARTEVDYVAFCRACDRYLDRQLEHGHLVDRCALQVKPHEAGLLVVVLSLCAGGDAVERAAALGRILECEDRDRLDALVGWLVQTGQIRPSKQVAEGSSSFPAQTYERRDAHGLVEEALAEAGLEGPFTDADVAAVLTSKAIDYH
jgi:hypothetical protein